VKGDLPAIRRDLGRHIARTVVAKFADLQDERRDLANRRKVAACGKTDSNS
jgi:hypothetical protein